MARQADDINSATCTFFVNLGDNAVLDHKDRTPQGYGYCVFGKVTEGLEVVEKIAQVPMRDTDRLDHIFPPKRSSSNRPTACGKPHPSMRYARSPIGNGLRVVPWPVRY